MSSWSSGSLAPTFLREIVGFDVRSSLFQIETGDSGPGSHKTSSFHPSLDVNVWPQCLIDTSLCDSNGFNLFDSFVDLQIPIEKASCCDLVCFDLPKSLVERIRNTFGVKSTKIDTLLPTGWKFLGFDIVDIRTQLSAIFSFTWNVSEIDIINSIISTNRYGLVNDGFSAAQAARYFDGLVREHAPFAPCGVWIRFLKNELKQDE